MTTETTTKRRMVAELIFANPDNVPDAIAELTDRGFEIRPLDWVDPEGGPAVWLLALIESELDQEAFLDWMMDVAGPLGADVIEAGYSGDDAAVAAWIAAKQPDVPA